MRQKSSVFPFPQTGHIYRAQELGMALLCVWRDNKVPGLAPGHLHPGLCSAIGIFSPAQGSSLLLERHYLKLKNSFNNLCTLNFLVLSLINGHVKKV